MFVALFITGSFQVVKIIVEAVSRDSDSAILQGLCFFVGWNFCTSVLPTVFDHVYCDHYLRKKNGAHVGSLRSFFYSHSLAFVLGCLVNAMIITGLVIAIVYLPKHWWIISILYLTGAPLVTEFVYPLLLQPIIDKTITLDRQPELRHRIQTIAHQLALELADIRIKFVLNPGSSHLVYATGFQFNKRLVMDSSGIAPPHLSSRCLRCPCNFNRVDDSCASTARARLSPTSL